MAFNEEANIGYLLEALGRQKLPGFTLLEVIVVASGCTDRTEAIVRASADSDPRIRLIVQERREGKASAVNLFLAEARGELLVLESADTLPRRDTLQRLLEPLANPQVGMTGARPYPVNGGRFLMGYAAHFFWWMHHTLALGQPKLGEMVAFRRVVRSIPPDTAVDEASIEAIVHRAGYLIHYSVDAIVLNRGPESLHDYLTQRRRIVAGHLHLRRTQGYSVASHRYGLILRNLARKLRDNIRLAWRLARRRQKGFLKAYVRHHFVRALIVPLAILMEILAEALGAWDYYVRGRNPYIWPVAATTKRLR
jgi:cellulose synthase/poly-beta-1,6-N-acetylglucosamine synthase-like glycosyltransferase